MNGFGNPHSARRRWRATLALIGLLVCAWAAMAVAAERRGGESGLPLPRYASLASDEVNMRKGPGPEYPIRWVYRRRGLPVRIVDEADTWRKIEDPEGDTGWVHAALLSSRRTVVVKGDIAPVYRGPSRTARLSLRVEPGVIGQLARCEAEWCLVEFDGVRGWIERTSLWGVDPVSPQPQDDRQPADPPAARG